jgi:hypothetical protein
MVGEDAAACGYKEARSQRMHEKFWQYGTAGRHGTLPPGALISPIVNSFSFSADVENEQLRHLRSSQIAHRAVDVHKRFAETRVELERQENRVPPVSAREARKCARHRSGEAINSEI